MKQMTMMIMMIQLQMMKVHDMKKEIFFKKNNFSKQG